MFLRVYYTIKQGGIFMNLLEYQSLIEKKYGKVSLPETEQEVSEIIDMIDDSMESVSIKDYHLFQAIEIIKDWKRKNDSLRKETTTFY